MVAGLGARWGLAPGAKQKASKPKGSGPTATKPLVKGGHVVTRWGLSVPRPRSARASSSSSLSQPQQPKQSKQAKQPKKSNKQPKKSKQSKQPKHNEGDSEVGAADESHVSHAARHPNKDQCARCRRGCSSKFKKFGLISFWPIWAMGFCPRASGMTGFCASRKSG